MSSLKHELAFLKRRNRVACVTAACVFGILFTCAAEAQQAGDKEIQIGWVRAQALDSNTSIHTDLNPSLGNTLLGVPNSFNTYGISTHARTVNTLAFNSVYFLTDHFSLELDAGVPPKVAIQGMGIAAPPGPSGMLFRVNLGDPALNPLGSSLQWSPVLALQYLFGNTTSRLRPFIGAGITYTWFTHMHLNPAFEQAINTNFGQPLAVAAGKPGPTSVDASVDPVWEPAYKLGISWEVSRHWGVTGSTTYIPYATTTAALLKAADGTTLATNQAKITVDALGISVLLSYRF